MKKKTFLDVVTTHFTHALGLLPLRVEKIEFEETVGLYKEKQSDISSSKLQREQIHV